MFHQVEGLLVDYRVTFSDLKGVLHSFARQMFGEGTRVRFRPHFFPFTEPSAEVDISCTVLQWQGVSHLFMDGVGSRSWVLDLLIQTCLATLTTIRIKSTGFAFGMGVDRIAMLHFGIPDLRLIFENDMRFLRQF